MAKYDGFRTTPIHKTKILPLRWFVNKVTHPISYYFFGKAMSTYLKYEDYFNIYPEFKMPKEDDRKYKINAKLHQILDKPYAKWGTTYKIDFLEDFKIEMLGSAWDDYDEFGNAYWDYDWHEDPATGDAWRLVDKKGKAL